jgi:hypothetical protein
VPDPTIGTLRRIDVSVCYSCSLARSEITLSYDEAMAVCLLLAEAADASVEDEPLRDCFAGVQTSEVNDGCYR